MNQKKMQNNPFTTRGSEIKLFIALLSILVLVLVVSVILGLRIERGGVSAPTEKASVDERQNHFEVSITASSAYVYDLRTKTVLYAKEENVRRPLASLSKIMSALVAKETSPLYSTIVVTPEALKALGDSGFYVNERWSLGDILDFSLITSSNDGMRAVALALGALGRSNASSDEIINDFVVLMNRKASELELKNTYFMNETGLDESEVMGGGYGTAKDINTLMEYVFLYHPEIIVATREPQITFRSLDNNIHVAKNTNTMTRNIPNLLASKTGYTNTAGGNLSIIFDPELGRPIIVTVLSSTETERFRDIDTLIKATMEYISQEK